MRTHKGKTKCLLMTVNSGSIRKKYLISRRGPLWEKLWALLPVQVGPVGESSRESGNGGYCQPKRICHYVSAHLLWEWIYDASLCMDRPDGITSNSIWRILAVAVVEPRKELERHWECTVYPVEVSVLRGRLEVFPYVNIIRYDTNGKKNLMLV
jgi:hypothetical protein